MPKKITAICININVWAPWYDGESPDFEVRVDTSPDHGDSWDNEVTPYTRYNCPSLEYAKGYAEAIATALGFPLEEEVYVEERECYLDWKAGKISSYNQCKRPDLPPTYCEMFSAWVKNNLEVAA